MNHVEPLHQAIIDHPDDEAARLIYADWLAERGDPRGEFIHVQCALERCVKESQRRKLRRRERELLQRHERAWLPDELLKVARIPIFRRGFVEQVTMSIRDFLKHAEWVFRLAPLREVVLTAGASRMRELAECELLARLAGITFSNIRFGDSGMWALAQSPHVRNLTRLRIIGCGVGPEGVDALAGSRHLWKLTALDLRNNRLNTRSAVESLGKFSSLWCLHFLDLSNNDLVADAMGAIQESPRWTKLEVLNLSGNRPLMARGAELLSEATNLSHLRHLDLSWCRIGREGAVAIARSHHLRQLSMLNLNGNVIRDSGARALAASPILAQLEDLRLSWNNLGLDGITALLSSPHWTGKTRLRLGMTKLRGQQIHRFEERYGRKFGLRE